MNFKSVHMAYILNGKSWKLYKGQMHIEASTTEPKPPLHNEGKCHLGDKGRSSRRIILEGGSDLLLGLVVPREPVDPRLDQDKTELGVPVLPVNLEVLAHRDRLFDEVPKVLRDGWSKSYPQTKGVCIILHKNNGGKKGIQEEKRNQTKCMSMCG
jgi:hypothetical protein